MTTTEVWTGPCGCEGCEKWADCYYCDGCNPDPIANAAEAEAYRVEMEAYEDRYRDEDYDKEPFDYAGF